MLKTHLVECKFTLKTNRDFLRSYDKYDKLMNTDYLASYVLKVPNYLQGKLNVGDVVLIHCSYGYQVCTVTKLNADTDIGEDRLASIVCKCDLEPYFNYVDERMED